MASENTDNRPVKIVDIAEARKRLRPPEPGSLAATLQNIETAFSAFGQRGERPNG